MTDYPARSTGQQTILLVLLGLLVNHISAADQVLGGDERISAQPLPSPFLAPFHPFLAPFAGSLFPPFATRATPELAAPPTPYHLYPHPGHLWNGFLNSFPFIAPFDYPRQPVAPESRPLSPSIPTNVQDHKQDSGQIAVGPVDQIEVTKLPTEAKSIDTQPLVARSKRDLFPGGNFPEAFLRLHEEMGTFFKAIFSIFGDNSPSTSGNETGATAARFDVGPSKIFAWVIPLDTTSSRIAESTPVDASVEEFDAVAEDLENLLDKLLATQASPEVEERDTDASPTTLEVDITIDDIYAATKEEEMIKSNNEEDVFDAVDLEDSIFPEDSRTGPRPLVETV